MSLQLRLLVTTFACTGLACSEPIGSGLASPGGEGDRSDGTAALLSIQCTVQVASNGLSCQAANSSQTRSSPQFSIIGGQGLYVQVTSSNVSYNSTTQTFQADVTVQNLLPDPLGTPDGTTVTGIRIFFHSGPTVTGGTGTVTVGNADGIGTFTGSAQPYFEYNELLTYGQTSAAKTWKWVLPPTVTQFVFTVYVHASVATPGSSHFPLLSLGDVQTCVILATNDARCWGDNFNGVFGNDSTLGANAPVPAAIGLRLRSLSISILGADWACGVSLPGDVYCWGTNYGTTPQLLASGMGFVNVEAGEKHACGLNAAGQAFCWGDNTHGNLGDGTTSDRNTPTAVQTSLTFLDIQAGSGFTCGLETSGEIYCWGSNLNGVLGDGTTNQRSLPDSVSGDLRFIGLSAGSYNACAVASNGSPYCWGELNGATVPALAPGGLTVKSISTGDQHTCVVDALDVGQCWGEGTDGQLGTGSYNSETTPAIVIGGLHWKSIFAQEEHSCGVSTADEVFCWGRNDDGQVGDGSYFSSNAPMPVTLP